MPVVPRPIFLRWPRAGSIAAVKRLLTLSIIVLVAGLLTTACNVTPPAATINGATISVSALNDQLRSFNSTQVGHCLLTAETGQTTQFQTQGTGGPGTYDMAFTDSILENSVGNELAFQLAASKGLSVSASDLTTAQQNFVATLNGEISAAAQQAIQSGTGSYCVAASGQPLTGDQVMAALPATIRNALIANYAVDEKLLADGADISGRGHLELLRRQSRALHRRLRELDRDRHPGPRQPVRRPDQCRGRVQRCGQGALHRHPDGVKRWGPRMFVHPVPGGTGVTSPVGASGLTDRANPGYAQRGMGDLRNHQPTGGVSVRRPIGRDPAIAADGHQWQSDRQGDSDVRATLQRVDRSSVRDMEGARSGGTGGTAGPVPVGRSIRSTADPAHGEQSVGWSGAERDARHRVRQHTDHLQ